jgi:hypothetical protein
MAAYVARKFRPLLGDTFGTTRLVRGALPGIRRSLSFNMNLGKNYTNRRFRKDIGRTFYVYYLRGLTIDSALP